MDPGWLIAQKTSRPSSDATRYRATLMHKRTPEIRILRPCPCYASSTLSDAPLRSLSEHVETVHRWPGRRVVEFDPWDINLRYDVAPGACNNQVVLLLYIDYRTFSLRQCVHYNLYSLYIYTTGSPCMMIQVLHIVQLKLQTNDP